MTTQEAFLAPKSPPTMKAALLDKPGRPLLICDVPTPSVGHGEVLVRLEACGVCHTDVHVRRSGSTGANGASSLILGHEGIGWVAEVGEGVDNWCRGDRIGVPWLHDTCGWCSECLEGAESFCQAQRAHGYNVNGAFAEYVTVDARYGVHLPATLDPIAAAPLMCAGVTAYGAIKTAGIELGSRCAIFGCGGLGLFAIQIARRAGANVVAIDVSPTKLEQAREMGAQHTLIADEQAGSYLKALGGMHAVINFAPTDATWPLMLEAIRPRGRIVAAAMVANEVPVSQEWLTATGVTITGTSVGTRSQMESLIDLHVQSPLVIRTTPIALAEVNNALDALARGDVTGRQVIDFRKAALS